MWAKSANLGESASNNGQSLPSFGQHKLVDIGYNPSRCGRNRSNAVGIGQSRSMLLQIWLRAAQCLSNSGQLCPTTVYCLVDIGPNSVELGLIQGRSGPDPGLVRGRCVWIRSGFGMDLASRPHKTRTLNWVVPRDSAKIRRPWATSTILAASPRFARALLRNAFAQSSF